MKDNKLKLNPGKMEVLIVRREVLIVRGHSSKLLGLPVMNEVMLSQIEKTVWSVCVCVSQSFSGGGNGQEHLYPPQLICQNKIPRN